MRYFVSGYDPSMGMFGGSDGCTKQIVSIDWPRMPQMCCVLRMKIFRSTWSVLNYSDIFTHISRYSSVHGSASKADLYNLPYMSSQALIDLTAFLN